LRSPRDKPLRSLMDVLLDALGYQARQPHQEDVSTSSTDAHKELLAGMAGAKRALCLCGECSNCSAADAPGGPCAVTDLAHISTR